MSSPPSDLFVGVVPFVATANARSFRLAAEQLGLTPSAVSKAVSRLEAELGVRLMNRSARSVTLTEEGAAFLVSCQDAVASLRAARERVLADQRVPRGRLNVSLPLILGRQVILPALKRLLDRHPALSIRVGLTDRFVQLADENVDVAVRIGHPKDSELGIRKLREVRWATVAAPAYLARHGTPAVPADLRRHNCLKFVRADGVEQEWEFAPDGREARDRPSVVTTRGNLAADHGEGLVEAAIRGLGLFQAHDYLVADAIARGELIEVLGEFAAPGPPISMLLATGRRAAPKVRVFAEFMLELLRT